MATKKLVLCFNGCTIQEQSRILSALPGWKSPQQATDEPSFIGEFSKLNTEYGGYSRFSFLDFNNDGRIDIADANIAADEIMGVIRKKFQLYDVRVVREDNIDAAINIVKNNSVPGDTLLTIAGRSEGAGGQAADDRGNSIDSCGAAGHSVGGARTVVDWGYQGLEARERFINLLSNIIAHEAGHTFGLPHLENIEAQDAANNSDIMVPYLGPQVLSFLDRQWSNGVSNHLTILTNLGSSGVEFRTRVTLKSANGKFLSAENGGGGVIGANRTSAYQWEHFDILYLPDGKVALESANGNYVSAENGGRSSVNANRSAIREWEKYTMLKVGLNKVAFKTHTGFYLRAGNGGDRVIDAQGETVSSWVIFEISSLRVYIQTDQLTYWRAMYGGSDSLSALISRPTDWEKFEIIYLNTGKVAIKTLTGKYVCAEDGGGNILIANRDTMGDWEKFSIIPQPNGKVALRTHNGKFIQYDNDGILKADGTTINNKSTFIVTINPNLTDLLIN
jgi:Fascin domain